MAPGLNVLNWEENLWVQTINNRKYGKNLTSSQGLRERPGWPPRRKKSWIWGRSLFIWRSPFFLLTARKFSALYLWWEARIPSRPLPLSRWSPALCSSRPSALFSQDCSQKSGWRPKAWCLPLNWKRIWNIMELPGLALCCLRFLGRRCTFWSFPVSLTRSWDIWRRSRRPRDWRRRKPSFSRRWWCSWWWAWSLPPLWTWSTALEKSGGGEDFCFPEC